MSISDWFRRQLDLDAEASIELGLQEQIIYVTGRHWIELLSPMVIPTLALLFFGGLAFYRSIGGSFLVNMADTPNYLDSFNWILISLVILIALIWTALWVREKQTRRSRSILVIAGATLSLLAYYRYHGGRVVSIDQTLSGGQSNDPVNWMLIGLGGLSVLRIVFNFYDWLNDELIVTNQRVVYDNDSVIIPRLFEQHSQRQIFLEDIQDVYTATKTYPQHWLGYGTIEVKSARFNGSIEFKAAKDPKQMQAAIMNQVRALRKAATTQDYGRMVAERVYGERGPTAARPQLQMHETEAWRWLRRIIPTNPEIDSESGKIVWRPHWLFLLQALVGPFTLLGGGLLSIVIGTRLITFDLLWVTLSTVFLLLVWMGWSAWEIEDYRNDMYILTPDKVIDIQKKPFGPEDRREAGLGQVNNVFSQTTYLSNLLGYGNVVLNTAGSGGSFTFNKVPRPADVVGVVTEYNVRAKQADKYRPLNDTLELLRYYHAAQLERDEIKRPSA